MEKKTIKRYKIYFSYINEATLNPTEYEVHVPQNGTHLNLLGLNNSGHNFGPSAILNKYEDAEVIAKALRVMNPKGTISIKEEIEERTFV